MIDSIIFDVDGTLWDSRAQVRAAWSGMIEELSGQPWEISDQDFTGLFGKPMTEIAKALFPNETDEEERMRKAALCYERENEYLSQVEPGVLFPGIRELLMELSSNYPLYIVSNCQRGYIEVMLSSTGLEPLFKGHLCFGDTNAEKAVTIRALMARHELTSPVYIGDTQGDADACRKAEIPFIFAEYGFGSAADPRWSIRTPEELPALLARENFSL